ncbi:MAG: prolipoprotein diacylglyceryl transferase [Lachnospiraceae bacterium]|nr:prolipoprotein diacylglyceryl transferase [Lachnospiraceae bacterium]
MDGTIRFPHLGITLTHVIKSFQVGGLEIACYGVVLSVAMMTGMWLVMRLAKATGQKEEDYFDLGIVAILVALVCARIYYVVFSWDYYRSHLAEIFNLRKGGLAIYGGVIGGVLTVLVFCHIRKLRYRLALDTMSVGLVWGQVLGRWGNFFNREAFGDYTDNLFAMQLPLSDVRASEITDTMRAHLETIDGVEYIQVHPTFLYESLWNLGVLAVLLFLTYLRRKKEIRSTVTGLSGNKPSGKEPSGKESSGKEASGSKAPEIETPGSSEGTIFLMYLLLYGAGRFWIEGLRTDQLILFDTGLPVSQVLSAILVVASLTLLIIGQLRRTKEDDPKGTIKKTD